MEGERQDVIGFQDGNGSAVMKLPDEVDGMLALHRLGWGTKAIAREYGVSRNTVKRYIAAGGWIEYRSSGRAGELDEHSEWLKEQYLKHRGNAEVVRQELEREKGIRVSLRTVERAVGQYRALLRAESRATTRYETVPGEQAQIDFGERMVRIENASMKVYFFVMTLSFSRRIYVRAFLDEKRDSWLSGIEGAFLHFGGVPREVLMDNAKALVKSHDAATRAVEYTDSFLAFARHWGFTPKACAPYRARTKGKDERGVGYVKHNAIAGREFESWAELESHLERWMREVADQRIHGTTEERPIDRFEREKSALKPLSGRPPFVQARELRRVVHQDLCVEVDTNSYSVPWQHIGREVTVRIKGGEVIVLYAGAEIARHAEARSRRARIVDSRHFLGLAIPGAPKAMGGELARSLDEYVQAAGGTR